MDDTFTLSEATALTIRDFGNETWNTKNRGVPTAVWVVGDRVEVDPIRFERLGTMGWLPVETRGRPYPLKPASPRDEGPREGMRHISHLAGDPTKRLLAIVAWSAIGSEQHSALYEWRSDTGDWKKLRDTTDQAVVGVYDIGLVAMDEGAIVVEYSDDFGAHPVRNWTLRSVGVKRAFPKFAVMQGDYSCPASFRRLAFVSGQLVAVGASCATQGKYVLEWWSLGPGKSQRKVLQEPIDLHGRVTPQKDALLVRPKADTGYRLVFKDGSWKRAGDAPLTGFEAIEREFSGAKLEPWRVLDAADGSVLVLANCRPEQEGDHGNPSMCLFRSVDTTSAATASDTGAAAPPASPVIPGEKK